MTPDLPTPSSAAVEELALRLRMGGWRFLLHGDGRDECFWIHRSEADPRLSCCKTLHRSKREITVIFSLDITAGHVTFAAAQIPDLADDLASFGSLSEVASFILSHDAALAEERGAP